MPQQWARAARVTAELDIRAPLPYRWARAMRGGHITKEESNGGCSAAEVEAAAFSIAD